MSSPAISELCEPYLAVAELKLTNFRNYSEADIVFDSKQIVITGDNGVGKTNLLEAISLLAAGRGLRGAALADLNNCHADKSQNWTIFARVNSQDGSIAIGTTRDTTKSANKRIIKVNGDVLSSQSQLGQYFSACWLTPAMDQIFVDGATSRRAYLDKLTGLFYPDHTKQLAIYNNARSQRMKLLLQNNQDDIWLRTLEQRIAEQAIAISAARIEIVQQLQHAIDSHDYNFPHAELQIAGYVEDLLTHNTALIAEGNLQEKLQSSRHADSQIGRTSYGSHRSDFVVIHSLKNQSAHLCSTGEQKALLLSITMATVKARKLWSGTAPVLLLDEVVAHLDKQKRAEFFDELLDLNTQTFLTGTDLILFEALNGKAQFIDMPIEF